MQIPAPSQLMPTTATSGPEAPVAAGRTQLGGKKATAVEKPAKAAHKAEETGSELQKMGFLNALLEAQMPQRRAGKLGLPGKAAPGQQASIGGEMEAQAKGDALVGLKTPLARGGNLRSAPVASLPTGQRVLAQQRVSLSTLENTVKMAASSRDKTGPKTVASKPAPKLSSRVPITGATQGDDGVELRTATKLAGGARNLATAQGAATRETYSQTLVVGESQLLAKSLKTKTGAFQKPVVTAASDAAKASDVKLNPLKPSLRPGMPRKVASDGLKPAPTEAPEAPQIRAKIGAMRAKTQAALASQNTAEPDTPPTVAALGPGATTGSAVVGNATPGTALRVDSILAHDVRQQVLQNLAGRVDTVTGAEKIVIRLNPENLGQVELTFNVRQDQLSVVIAADSPDAQHALREDVKDLSERISKASTRFSHVDVRVETREASETRQQSRQDQKDQGRGDGRRDQERAGQESDGEGQQGHHARHKNEVWENVMSWQLADEATSQEG